MAGQDNQAAQNRTTHGSEQSKDQVDLLGSTNLPHEHNLVEEEEIPEDRVLFLLERESRYREHKANLVIREQRLRYRAILGSQITAALISLGSIAAATFLVFNGFQIGGLVLAFATLGMITSAQVFARGERRNRDGAERSERTDLGSER